MNTFRPESFLSEIEREGVPIPMEKRAYLAERVRLQFYDYVIGKFMEAKETRELTKAKLARRIGRKPDQISKILSGPGNWTIELLSDLLVGIAAEELKPHSESLLNRAAQISRNFPGSLNPPSVETDDTKKTSGVQILETTK
jgi:hypothetical protein